MTEYERHMGLALRAASKGGYMIAKVPSQGPLHEVMFAGPLDDCLRFLGEEMNKPTEPDARAEMAGQLVEDARLEQYRRGIDNINGPYASAVAQNQGNNIWSQCQNSQLKG